MNELQTSRMQEYRSYIDGYLADIYSNRASEPQKILFESMRYSLLAGGKRIRAMLAMEFCRLCGGDWRMAAPYAAAVEMIHTYSLIHDDLPCMDDDDLRRGKPTNHKVYGEAIAVLAGDALLTDAFMVAAAAKEQNGQQVRRAVQVLAECAGSIGMVGGQVLDIMSEERVLTEQEVLDIQSRKTGCLIRAACVLGVIAAGGNEDRMTAAGEFADSLGLAFQIRDDMLDVIGSAEDMGKATGTDSGKNTFVRLYGLSKCEELVAYYTEKALRCLDLFDDSRFLAAFAKDLINRTA